MLVRYFNKEVQLAELKKYPTDDIPVNEIEKDFGEALGPIYLLNNPADCKKVGMSDITKASKIFVPSRPNEPPMDYAIITSNRSYLISAKIQGSSNTVKAADTIMLLKKNKGVNYKKWERKSKRNLMLFETLADKGLSSVQAPLATCVALAKSGDAESKKLFATNITESDVKAVSKTSPLPTKVVTACAQFIKANDYLKGKKTFTSLELNYELEKYVVKYGKANRKELTEIFLDAVCNNVKYVKFAGIAVKTPKFEIISDDKMSEKVVEFR